jgi:hypothetical protein
MNNQQIINLALSFLACFVKGENLKDIYFISDELGIKIISIENKKIKFIVGISPEGIKVLENNTL